MTQAQSKSYGGVKKKLMGAICMLLVASIMVVSSTYAWFTLSTAPEITGISTSVGANGNLEMALLDSTTYGKLGNIKSAVGNSIDAGIDVKEANKTWGNLVDLSAGYGFDNIVLNPARLAADGTTKAVTMTSPLKTAEYGSDGRVTMLQANTMMAAYDEGSAAFTAKEQYGVRAIGAANAMSDAQIALRNAQAAVTTSRLAARNMAQAALNTYGAELATIALKHLNAKAGTDDAGYTRAQVVALGSTIGELEKAAGQIETALKNVVVAGVASTKGVAVDVKKVSFTEGSGSWTVTFDGVADVTYTPEGNLLTALNAWKALSDKITGAQSKLPEDYTTAAESTTYSWENIKDAMSPLVDTNNVTINGFTFNEVKNNISSLIGQSLTIQMPNDSGVLADIAAFCDNYSAGIHLQPGTLIYEPISAGKNGMDLAMETTVKPAEGSDFMLKQLAAEVSKLTAGRDEAAEAKITDTYGYAIDLAFRTNAADSDLMLADQGMQRIYSEGGVDNTQGGGSYMQFKSADAGFSENSVKDLMKAIRIVFLQQGTTENTTNTILGVATLDTAHAKTDAEGVRATLQMTDYKFEEGVINVETVKAGDDALKVVPLPQNEAVGITVLVYLDGDAVQNKDVANAAQSMTGKMNLQFKSSAELHPMDYTPLNTNKKPTP